MIMVLGPHKKKSEAKAEVQAAKEPSAPPRARPSAPRSTPSGARARRRRTPKKERRRSENLDPDDRAAGNTSRRNATHMPKMKTHTGAAKRFRVTGSGKIRRQQAGLRHNLEQKPSKRTRRMTGTIELAKADVKRVKKLLGR